MGAALTYARRYALFTLVGIAGEDDLDAPDLNGSAGTPAGLAEMEELGQYACSDQGSASPSSPRASLSAFPLASDSTRHKQVRPPHVFLPAEESATLREQLISDLNEFKESEALTVWTRRILTLRDQLTTADAQAVEAAFTTKLDAMNDEAPTADTRALGGQVSINVNGSEAVTAKTGASSAESSPKKTLGSREI